MKRGALLMLVATAASADPVGGFVKKSGDTMTGPLRETSYYQSRGLPTASFPVCNTTTTKGAFLYDTTLNQLMVCNGTSWGASGAGGASSSRLSLFVDPTGSDSNACTSTGTSACLTLQGAFNKVPNLLEYPITVTLANGTYAGGALRAVQYAPATDAGAYVAVIGSLITFANPDGGTASGTATSATACAEAVPPTLATLTDSTQSWVVNQFRGYLVNTTGGTGSGQFLPIASNTATTLTIAGCWGTTPNATTTYTVKEWGANITSGPVRPADYLNTPSASANIGLVFEGIAAERGTTSTAGVVYVDSVLDTAATPLIVNNSHFLARRSKFAAPTTGIGLAMAGSGPRVTVQASVLSSASAQALFQFGVDQGSAANPSMGSALRLENTYLQSGTTSTQALYASMPGLFISGGAITMTSATAAAGLQIDGQSTGNWITDFTINCVDAAATVGILMSPVVASSQAALEFSRSQTVGCRTGASVVGPLAWFMTGHSSTFVAPTDGGVTGLNVSSGATAWLHSGTAASGTFTNQISMDSGGVTAAFSDVTGGTCVSTLAYHSKACVR